MGPAMDRDMEVEAGMGAAAVEVVAAEVVAVEEEVVVVEVLAMVQGTVVGMVRDMDPDMVKEAAMIFPEHNP